MATTMLPLTRGRNLWLASIADEVALILSDYLGHRFTLATEQANIIVEFKGYLGSIARGIEYTNNWRESGLSFDDKTLEAISALEEIVLVLPGIDPDQFIQDFNNTLDKIQKKEPVDHSKTQDLKNLLLKIAHAVFQRPYNPEASHAL